MLRSRLSRTALSAWLFAGAVFALTHAVEADAAEKKTSRSARPPSKSAKKAPPPPPEVTLPDADAEQVKAAEMVFFGKYECEFNQSIDIALTPKHPAYVELKSGKSQWLMKPVLSSTGAIRLEDVKGETLMVQIASKSMLLNVKTAKRIVDDCVSMKQRELMEEARIAKAAAATAAPAADASASAADASGAPATLLQAPAPR